MPPLVVPQLVNNLSDMNLYMGELKALQPSPYTIPYELATPLFTDNAHKQRLIALPAGETMSYVDDGLPIFPDNSVISKTFFYNFDENDPSAGRQIIETRILIKQDGLWVLGNYHWNADQTEAILMSDSATLPITYIDEEGVTNNIDYVIPGAGDCFTCHNLSNSEIPIGPKLRTLNFNGQLQDFIDSNHISGLIDASLVSSLPSWDDTSLNREQRARAYFDMNCAHCHSEGGYCEDLSTLRLSYETPFDQTNIYNQRNSIMMRMQEVIPGFSMPWIGTTTIHDEGYELITSYLNSLD
ncbi:MAG: hypothetical protein HKN00_04775 [Flavobacteriaceae bacterium]|nr:hypothetical protein [Bacteroidia bacterium]MBT8288630.1 hypothetical protein [Bacteroidia bacterium]NNF74476.1 hypothetical protein [Flavobacteriaceae bacterium]NNK72533.1 hypothetical protein [Flavobacteriaceae bacterium]